MFHERPYTILRTVAGDTLNCFAITELFSPDVCASRILPTLTTVSFIARLGLLIACLLWAECALFSLYVAHTKFLYRLFFLLSSSWLIVGLPKTWGTKAKATSLCTRRYMRLPSTPFSDSSKYLFFFVFGRIIRDSLYMLLRTRPLLLISYSGASGIIFHFSINCSGWYTKKILYHKWGG